MKILKCKKTKGRNIDKYVVTIKIDDNDINMFEDLAYTYTTQGAYGERYHNLENYDEYDLLPDIKYRCAKWFQELWKNCWKGEK